MQKQSAGAPAPGTMKSCQLHHGSHKAASGTDLTWEIGMGTGTKSVKNHDAHAEARVCSSQDPDSFFLGFYQCSR